MKKVNLDPMRSGTAWERDFERGERLAVDAVKYEGARGFQSLIVTASIALETNEWAHRRGTPMALL